MKQKNIPVDGPTNGNKGGAAETNQASKRADVQGKESGQLRSEVIDVGRGVAARGVTAGVALRHGAA